MKANLILVVGTVTKEPFRSDKGFAAVNVEIPGPDGRGRAWLDVVGFNGVSEKLAELKIGQEVRILAAPDSRKTEARGWQMRFVAESVGDDIALTETT